MTGPTRVDISGLVIGRFPRKFADIPAVAPTDERETPEEAAARWALATARRYRMWRVPSKFKDASVDALDAAQNPGGKVSGWWVHGPRTLILWGDRKGTGKSHAAHAIGHQAVAARTDVAGWSTVDLIDAIKPGGDQTAYDLACTVPLLILDDLGAERVTDWTTERLGGLVDQRWRDGLRTIVTTNLGYTELVGRYGDRIIDRLTDDAIIVNIAGPSRRAPAAW